MFKKVADFVEDPKRLRPPSQRVEYLYDFREAILRDFARLKRIPNICDMPVSREAMWV
jgi:hypothetical protein